MAPRDGAGVHALSAILFVISLLHLCHGFVGDFLRAASGMAAFSPERERVII